MADQTHPQQPRPRPHRQDRQPQGPYPLQQRHRPCRHVRFARSFLRTSSGSLAILAAIRRASSLVRSLAARASAHSHSKAAGMLKPAALPYSPQMPTSGKASLGLSDWLWGRAHTLCPPHASQGAKVPARPQKHIARAVGLQRQFLRPAESTDNRSQDQRGAPGIGATSGKHCADTEPLRL